MRFRLRTLLIDLALGSALLAATGGCGQNPKISVSATVEGQEIVFLVPHEDVNGLLEFKVEDDQGTTLWEVQLSYEKGHRLVYGVLPAGGNMPAKQVYPPNQQPPQSIRGKKVIAVVDYQFDDGFAPSSDSLRQELVIP